MVSNSTLPPVTHFEIVDRQTNKVVGSAETRVRANQSVDKRDAAHGGYRYFARPVYEKPDYDAWHAAISG